MSLPDPPCLRHFVRVEICTFSVTAVLIIFTPLMNTAGLVFVDFSLKCAKLLAWRGQLQLLKSLHLLELPTLVNVHKWTAVIVWVY